MPSISACDVQPAVKRQTRTTATFAPGAAPLIWPPKRLLPAMIPVTWVPWAPETIPMPTYACAAGSVWTTNGTDSLTGVAGLSCPKWPMSWLTL